MNVQIPIAGLTLSNGETYNGQLPVWVTRPFMIRVLPDYISGSEYPVYVRVTNGGAIKKEIVLPYQEVLYLDLSFAAPLLTRADRNNSDGNPVFPQQLVEIWSSNPANKITLPVFHCDETYWDTLGVDSALPQPPKPRIPNQTLDIYFPYRIHPSDAFPVEVEPVTGAPSSAIFPTTYVLGNTIDITYIKKLTIKNVWGSGLDQVINYEDRLMSDVVYDESLQCALRARWNMRNGQWFWGAFKDYFWSNKFTPIRGRGGVTEQAEITINLEYGEEYYNVYQELLVSSNVVFELNIPGINQYQSKRFRAEVSGDTGARWSNSTKTYRQQVRFTTTELQDNYMSPLAPDNPPTPSIVFSAQHSPWLNNSANYMEGMRNNIYSNAAWEVQSVPDWLAPGSKIPLTPADFVQGAFTYEAGAYWEDLSISVHSQVIRTTKPISTRGRRINMISLKRGYQYAAILLDADGKAFHQAYKNTDAGGLWGLAGAESFILTIRKLDASETGLLPITPAEMATAGIGVQDANKLFDYPAGTSYFTATIAVNTGEARTDNIVLKSLAGSATYAIPITQQKASISLSPSSLQVGNAVHTGFKLTGVTANTDWEIVPGGAPSWMTITSYSGAAGTSNIFADIQANTGAQRTAYITLRSKVNTSVTAILSVTQAGISGNISASPSTVDVDYVVVYPVTVDVTSFGSWSVSQRDTWITPDLTEGAPGDTAVELTIGDNTSNDARTGTITFYNDLTGGIAVVTVNQAGAPYSIGVAPTRVTGPKSGGGATKTLQVISQDSWAVDAVVSWGTISPMAGAAGATNVTFTYDTTNATGAARTGELRIKNIVTNEIAICLITQEG